MVAKKGASILSIAVFFKIWGNILKKYLLFRLERTTEWEYTSSFFEKPNLPQQIFFSDDTSTCYSGLQEAFKDLGIQQVSMLQKDSIPVR